MIEKVRLGYVGVIAAWPPKVLTPGAEPNLGSAARNQKVTRFWCLVWRGWLCFEDIGPC